MTEAEQRARLGALVAARREQLRLSIPKAAEAAGIYRDTWRDLEAGTRALRGYNHPAVETVLGWEPGSIKAVLAGDEPTLAAEGSETKRSIEPERDQFEELILSDPVLTDRQKKALLEEYHLGQDSLERDIRSKIALFKRAG